MSKGCGGRAAKGPRGFAAVVVFPVRCGDRRRDTDPMYTDPMYTDPMYTDLMYTDPMYTDPVYTDRTRTTTCLSTAESNNNV